MTSQPKDVAQQMGASRADIALWLAAQGLQAQLVSIALTSLSERLFGSQKAATPAQAPLHLLEEAADKLLVPVASHHPWALVSVAAVTGAALAASKPWRWLLRPEVVASIATGLGTRLMANASPPSAQENAATSAKPPT